MTESDIFLFRNPNISEIEEGEEGSEAEPEGSRGRAVGEGEAAREAPFISGVVDEEEEKEEEEGGRAEGADAGLVGVVDSDSN